MAISNTELAQRISDLLDQWHSREDEMLDWLGGTVSGGPNNNGTYPITDGTGTTHYVDAPAKLEDVVTGPAGAARDYRDLAFEINHKPVDTAINLSWSITEVDASTGSFTIGRDQSPFLKSGDTVSISGSTGNDGTYTLASDSAYDANADETTVSVSESVPDSTADGSLAVDIGYSVYHYRQKAADSASAAAASEINAASSESLASDHAADAQNYMNNAQSARDKSQTYRDESYDWAEAGEDVSVEDSAGHSGYSAYHHRSKAEAAQSDAETAESNAASHESDAQTYRDDAYHWAEAAEDSSVSDSAGHSGYSAWHHAEKARQAKETTESYANGMKWQADVLAEQNDPPSSPSAGDRYLVGPSPTGDWSGYDQNIATWDGSVWSFDSPSEGWSLNVNGSNLDGRSDVAMIYNGSDWVNWGSAIDHNVTQTLQGGTTGEYYHLTSADHTLVGSLSHNLANLTDAEVTQLEAIGSTTISNTQWGYLGGLGSAPLEDDDLVANGGSVPEVDRSNTFTGTTQTIDGGLVVGSGASSNGAGTVTASPGSTPQGFFAYGINDPGYKITETTSGNTYNGFFFIDVNEGYRAEVEGNQGLAFNVNVGNTSLVIGIDAGIYTPNATGGSQGADTMNAKALYDDGTQLDYVFDAVLDGTIYPEIEDYPELAEAFLTERAPWVYDVDQYAAYWREHRHLPSHRSRAEMQEQKPHLGELARGNLEAIETQAVQINSLHERIKELEKSTDK